MTLHSQSQDGTLTRSDLDQYLETLSTDIFDGNGHTPLALAVKNGHPSVVKLLLQNGANANKPTRDGRSPLYLAANAKQNRARVVQLLLSHQANVDESSPEWGNDTALMVAITQSRDPEVIRLLLDAGASLTKSNDRGDTALSLADQMSSPAIKNALLPKDQQSGWKTELVQVLVNAVLFALAYFGNWKGIKDILGNTIRTLYNLTRPSTSGSAPPPGTNYENPKTKEEFKHNINNIIQESGLDDFFPPGDPYIDQVASRAAEMRKDVKNTLNSTDDIHKLALVALYQPVLYCDDSGSMQQENRMEHQSALVQRMTNVATRLVPNNHGVHLRFINRDDATANSLRADEVERRMAFSPVGGTPIGTNLRTKVLQPLVYDVIETGVLQRPFLIMTITDGCPEGENTGTFRDVVVECTEKLSEKGYENKAVMFDLSQIGNAPEAVKFMDDFQFDDLLKKKGVLHITAEHLDEALEDLKKDEKLLDQWLLKTLTACITYKNNP